MKGLTTQGDMYNSEIASTDWIDHRQRVIISFLLIDPRLFEKKPLRPDHIHPVLAESPHRFEGLLSKAQFFA